MSSVLRPFKSRFHASRHPLQNKNLFTLHISCTVETLSLRPVVRSPDIAYPADKSWKHNRLIQAFSNRTVVTSHLPNSPIWRIKFHPSNAWMALLNFLRLIRWISYPSSVQPAPEQERERKFISVRNLINLQIAFHKSRTKKKLVHYKIYLQ